MRGMAKCGHVCACLVMQFGKPTVTAINHKRCSRGMYAECHLNFRIWDYGLVVKYEGTLRDWSSGPWLAEWVGLGFRVEVGLCLWQDAVELHAARQANSLFMFLEAKWTCSLWYESP